MSSLNNLPVYSPQQQQQVYQPPPLTQEQLSEMANYYNQIYQKLFQILYTEYGKKYIDGLNLFQLAQSSNEIPKDKINNIFKDNKFVTEKNSRYYLLVN